MISQQRAYLMKIAVSEAGKLLRELSIDLTAPVDVFGIIKKLEITLMFRPLEGDSDGFFLPKNSNGSVAGILLNSNRSLSRQRYTAAHELCHYIRKDTARIEVVSEELSYLSKDRTDDEKIADFFAAQLLMPPKLVTFLFRKFGLKKQNISEDDLYRISLCLRTSYQATNNQLYNLGFITQAQHRQFGKIPPRIVKKRYTRKIGHNDVWVIDDNMDGFTILPTEGDQLMVQLDEIPSTGYIWNYKLSSDHIITSINEQLSISDNPKFVGSPGKRILYFGVLASGDEMIYFKLQRPWQSNSKPVRTFTLKVISSERNMVGHYCKEQFLIAA